MLPVHLLTDHLQGFSSFEWLDDERIPFELRVILNKKELLQFVQNEGLTVIFHNIDKSSVELILSKATQAAESLPSSKIRVRN